MKAPATTLKTIAGHRRPGRGRGRQPVDPRVQIRMDHFAETNQDIPYSPPGRGLRLFRQALSVIAAPPARLPAGASHDVHVPGASVLRKHGFEVVAVVDDHPRGHKNLLLRKRLGESS
jgi:hypothetical protein